MLIGLALLPFAIPILWLCAPALFGEHAVLSIATPIALAVSASVLCLAVIYTVDWTPTTRVKGVLMLVSLAYFSAVSLYFLKKEMIERIQQVTGLEEKIEWQQFRNRIRGGYAAKPQPGPKTATNRQSLKLECFASSYKSQNLGRYEFVVGWAARLSPEHLNGTEPGTKEWFADREMSFRRTSGQRYPQNPPLDVFPGLDIEIAINEKGTSRSVRFYLVRGTVYYLSVERPSTQPNEDPILHFFSSFYVKGAKD